MKNVQEIQTNSSAQNPSDEAASEKHQRGFCRVRIHPRLSLASILFGHLRLFVVLYNAS